MKRSRDVDTLGISLRSPAVAEQHPLTATDLPPELFSQGPVKYKVWQHILRTSSPSRSHQRSDNFDTGTGCAEDVHLLSISERHKRTDIYDFPTSDNEDPSPRDQSAILQVFSGEQLAIETSSSIHNGAVRIEPCKTNRARVDASETASKRKQYRGLTRTRGKAMKKMKSSSRTHSPPPRQLDLVSGLDHYIEQQVTHRLAWACYITVTLTSVGRGRYP